MATFGELAFLYVVNSQKRSRKKKFTAGVKFINTLPAGRFTGKNALKTSKMPRLEKIICFFTKYSFKQSTTVYVPSSELGFPQPLSPQ
jgi:hypothetical protein